MKTFFKLSLGLLLFVLSSQANAKNPLKRQVRFVLPNGVDTVAEATHYFIEPHGFKLYFGENAPRLSKRIASSRLQRSLPTGRVMTIENAILSLLPENQALIVDLENKLVSFNYTRLEQGVKNED